MRSATPPGRNGRLVGDPGLALGLCLFPKQVGRCLPMSPIVRLRGLEPPCLSASGPQPDVSAGFHHSRESWYPVRDLHPRRLGVGEESCSWKNRVSWMRDSESHGACVLMRHARRLRLPSRRMLGGPGRSCTCTPGGRPLLRRSCLLVPPRARGGGSGRICTSSDPGGSTALEAAAYSGCATEPGNLVLAGRRGSETAWSCGRELAPCERFLGLVGAVGLAPTPRRLRAGDSAARTPPPNRLKPGG